MALIAECDHPGCQERTRASWLPSGRLVVEGWFVLPATHLRPLALACCQEHVPGVPKALLDAARKTGVEYDESWVGTPGAWGKEPQT